MESARCKAFILSAELGSFSKAGEQLGYSQPTVSVQIRQLEEELGAKLFDRVRKSYAFSSKVCILGGAVCGGLLFLFAGPVISLFNRLLKPLI